jgi:pimeloyl-ACP methyl ester carboxylesterase
MNMAEERSDPPENAMSVGHGDYAHVNGLKLYYEIHGTGSPLVLLHGGLGAIAMFGPSLSVLAKRRQVIAVDLQGHGRTADIDRALDVELMADDMASLSRHLGMNRFDVMGYSLGGLVAIQTAIRHPEIVRKLIPVSAPIRRSAVYAQRMELTLSGPALAESMKQTPVYELYRAVAPRLEDWPVLVTKVIDAMMKPFDYSADVRRMQTPTLIVCADADIFPPSHAAECFELPGGGRSDPGMNPTARPMSRLAVLPGLTHYTVVNAPALWSAVESFLDEPEASRRG